MVLVFIDGPLAEEVKPWMDAPLQFHVALPVRITTCYCLDDWGEESRKGPGIFTYHRILIGKNVALYSKNENDEEILHSLKSWVVTDLSRDWHFACHDRRAYQ